MGAHPTSPAAAAGAAPTFASVYETRRNNFDCIRFLLASMVIWSHCFPLSGRAMDWCYAWSGQIDAGSLAVDGFFVASGFLVTQSWSNCPHPLPFARKRLLRIVPAMVAALVFGALIIGPLNTAVPVRAYLTSTDPWRHFLGIVFNRYLYMATVFTTNPLPHVVNAPLWSLRYEMLCYAAVPLLALAPLRHRRSPVILAFVACWIWYAVVPARPGDPVMRVIQTAARLSACFSAGMLFYLFRDRVPYRVDYAAAAAAMLLVSFLAGGFASIFPIAGGYLLLYAAFSPALPLSRFGRYGDFSYGLYVFAYPVQQSIVHALGPGVPIQVFFAMSFAAALGLAFLSWHLIEAPALSLKPKGASATQPAVFPALMRRAAWAAGVGRSKVQV